MCQMDYDIVIIGGGPAGAVLAASLGTKFKVAIIDPKSSEPASFSKCCGGLLSEDAQRALSKLGLTLPKSVLVDPQIFSVKTIDLGSRLCRDYQRTYVNLDRKRFDLWLLSLLPEQVDFLHGRVLSVRRADTEGQTEQENQRGHTNRYLKSLRQVHVDDAWSLTWRDEKGVERNVRSKVLVGADGANSLLRQVLYPKAKIHSYVAIQQHFAECNPKAFYSCIFDHETSDCCSWSISKDQKFVFGGAFPAQGCRARFERQKEKLSALGFRFGELIKTEACRVIRPASPGDFFLGRDGAFLIGEAAGLISASSLEGISHALRSAAALAEACQEIALTDSQRLHRVYRNKSRKQRLNLIGKILKGRILYHPGLRYLIMKSGLQSLAVRELGEPRGAHLLFDV